MPGTQPAGAEHLSPQLDMIAITCPPIPGGAGGGLFLQPNFKVCGTWGSDQPLAQLQVTCQFLPAGGGAAIHGAVTINANNTWFATFNINPPLSGSLKAVLIDNGVQTAQAVVGGLKVVAAGGSTCNC
jgi:hypothetical protein